MVRTVDKKPVRRENLDNRVSTIGASPVDTPEVDYVIVGAGSAGAILAARLSEDPGITVALIAAGGEADWKSVVEGKRGSVRVDLGGSRIIKKNKINKQIARRITKIKTM